MIDDLNTHLVPENIDGKWAEGVSSQPGFCYYDQIWWCAISQGDACYSSVIKCCLTDLPLLFAEWSLVI